MGTEPTLLLVGYRGPPGASDTVTRGQGLPRKLPAGLGKRRTGLVLLPTSWCSPGPEDRALPAAVPALSFPTLYTSNLTTATHPTPPKTSTANPTVNSKRRTERQN